MQLKGDKLEMTDFFIVRTDRNEIQIQHIPQWISKAVNAVTIRAKGPAFKKD